ncbi:MAG: hypothetical protein AAFZ65_19660 [Planctomycetota bacterium]
MQRITSLLLLAAVPSLAIAGDQTANVDFESGLVGWTGPTGPGGASQIVADGGNGGGAGYQTVFNNFFVTFANATNPAYLGDYSRFDSVTLSVDIKVNQIDFFFQPVPRPWLVELRDYDSAVGGFPWTSVWFKFADISAASEGDWTTFSVTIDDPTSAALPAGWRGYGAEDPTTFEPILPAGVTFADVLSGVDEIAFTTGEPGFFFGFTDFDLVLDNLSVTTVGGPWCDLGQGSSTVNGTPKLLGFGDVTPGAPTTLALAGAAPNAPTLLGVGFSNPSLPLLGSTLLTSADITIIETQTNGLGSTQVAFPWPNGLAPQTSVFWQSWVVDLASPTAIVASNGLESVTP